MKKVYNIDKDNIIDFDELTNIEKLNNQIEYIFAYTLEQQSKNNYAAIDESINVFIAHSIDIRRDAFLSFLTICSSMIDDLKNYNRLYHETYLKFKKIMNNNQIDDVLKEFKRNDYDEWIRSEKLNRIIKNKNKF